MAEPTCDVDLADLFSGENPGVIITVYNLIKSSELKTARRQHVHKETRAFARRTCRRLLLRAGGGGAASALA